MLFQSDDFLVAFTNRSAHVQTSGYSGSQNIVLVLPLNNHPFDLEKGAGYKLLSQEIMTKPGKKKPEFILLQHSRCVFCFAASVPWFFPTLQGHQGGSQRTKGVKGFSTRPLTTALLSLPPAQQNKRPKGVVYTLWMTLFQKPKDKALDPNLFFDGVSQWNMALTLSSTFCDKRIFGVWIRAELNKKYQIFSKLNLPPFFPTPAGRDVVSTGDT